MKRIESVSSEEKKGILSRPQEACTGYKGGLRRSGKYNFSFDKKKKNFADRPEPLRPFATKKKGVQEKRGACPQGRILAVPRSASRTNGKALEVKKGRKESKRCRLWGELTRTGCFEEKRRKGGGKSTILISRMMECEGRVLSDLTLSLGGKEKKEEFTAETDAPLFKPREKGRKECTSRRKGKTPPKIGIESQSGDKSGDFGRGGEHFPLRIVYLGGGKNSLKGERGRKRLALTPRESWWPFVQYPTGGGFRLDQKRRKHLTTEEGRMRSAETLGTGKWERDVFTF